MRSLGMLNQVVHIVTTVHQKIDCICVVNLFTFLRKPTKKKGLSKTYSMMALFRDVTLKASRQVLMFQRHTLRPSSGYKV